MGYLYDTQPRLRVCWIIPIHGRVELIDSRLTDSRFQPEPAILRTSSEPQGEECEFDRLIMGDRARENPAVERHEPTSDASVSTTELIWTRGRLEMFWRSVQRQVIKGYLGPMSACISGPWPDPFRPGPPPLGMLTHDHLDPAAPPLDHRQQGFHQPPVRCSTGDHVRLYCDLEHAMAVRLWLRDDVSFFPRQGKTKKTAFDCVKLCLLGPRGEVLGAL